MKKATLISIVTFMIIILSACAAHKLKIDWNPVPNAARYRVYVANSPNGFVKGKPATEVKGGTTSVIIPGIDSRKPWYATVTTVNAAGIESDFSSVAELAPPVKNTVHDEKPAAN